MKNFFWIISILFITTFVSCKKEDEVTCITCISADTISFEICHESDGNASINGENTGIPFNIYLSDLEETGAKCGK